MARKTTKKNKQVETLIHEEATRKNIPTAELQSAAQRIEETSPFEPVRYPRADQLTEGETRPRDKDLDPQIVWKGTTLRLNKDQINQLTETGKLEIGNAQLVWRGKDQKDWSDLVVQAPPLYIQEKIHPKAIIEDLKRQTKEREEAESDTLSLFEDFNGLDPDAKTEFYQHDQNWQNRMILGDSLQVMASLAEREGLRGQVQCIYFDPPYGIKFNSNWQVSTRSREVKDGKLDQITREPEQVKAFRDTWKDGIHSYLTYLRDRLTTMRDLLTESGSIFVQIGDENVHRVRALADEVFGEENFVSQIAFQKTGGFSQSDAPAVLDYALWYARNRTQMKVRRLYESLPDPSPADPNYTLLELPDTTFRRMTPEERRRETPLPSGSRIFRYGPLTSDGRSSSPQALIFEGEGFEPRGNSHWKTNLPGMERLVRAGKILRAGNNLAHRLYWDSFPAKRILNVWLDTQSGGFNDPKIYVVQSTNKVVQRCILMATDPGDLVLDPTCGSGTTAYVAEQWGRRWITIDTSRVSLALARARLMSARYPYYLLADSEDGGRKEAELKGKPPSDAPARGDIRQGFVYERAPHITLKSIANNAEIDVIWENYQDRLEALRKSLNESVGVSWEEWEIPREAGDGWSDAALKIHADWWELRKARQEEIDKSIAQKADIELLYDRPYEDTSKVRVTGPFTVESLSPHRIIPEGEEVASANGSGNDGIAENQEAPLNDFTQMIIDNLRSAGVHQAAKDDRITFTSIDGWPGAYIAADGRFLEGETEKRAAIFIGPEFGTVTRADLTAAAREALDTRFDALIACGFNFEAHTSELTKIGPLPILKAKMNPDLHMSEELKNTGAGNLFVVFGEPDIEWDFDEDGNIVVEVLGVDVFDPKTGDVRASGKDDIAAWFIDTDYNEESFFVRHAYFMGANDPYKSLKTSLKAEIDKEAWETLYRDKSRPFSRPSTGRFAVKVINHFGDEVMKIFGV
ncbi:site-specific DNA-methyltransferase [Methyloligella solikamskensis]|uniref:site-specific DNA-methyltransferase (adenine-specific) n=1 Tax=Methyloligella solikamskensis TaxID=1177756 RepID=A0ABW3J7N2_9HYPH